MGFRKDVWHNISVLWNTVMHLDHSVRELRHLKKDIILLQAQIMRLGQEWSKTTIKTNGLQTQITNLKQEICGLKTGHSFIYQGTCNLHIFNCELCGCVEVKTDNELTPTEKKSLQTLGILKNESAKKRGN